MAYQIDRYNNTILTVVEDGTVDQTTDLKFIGKNYAGYGEIQNENFLYLLENFAGANQPPRALSGQIWFDSANSKLKFYDGTQWRTTGGSAVATAEPTGLTSGDFWWDSGNEQLYVYNGNDFILIGPQNAGEGVTQMVSTEVLDTLGNTHAVIVAYINDDPVAVFSPDSTTFTINPSTPIGSFTTIGRGITIPTDARYYGISQGALNLVDSSGNVIPADNVVISEPGTSTVFTDAVEFADAGLTVGESLDGKIYIQNDTELVVENQSGLESIILFKTTDAVGTSTDIFSVSVDGLIPATDNTFDMGTTDYRWANIYAVNFVGEASKATSLRVGSDFRTASVSASNNTVAVRDGSGNLAATLFQGTATAARYADLAEKYSTDQEYPVGTVMAVGGEAEARAAKLGDLAIGVISEKPAYLMNSEAEGQAVALKGRVPVRVSGPVSKGQPVYVADQLGTASTIASNSLVGVALETNHDEGEKLVECVLKV